MYESLLTGKFFIILICASLLLLRFFLRPHQDRKKDQLSNLPIGADHSEISERLYMRFCKDFAENSFDKMKDYCSNVSFVLNVAIDSFVLPICLYKYFVSKNEYNFEYLFVSFDKNGCSRRIVVTFGYLKDNYVYL